ncbi:hypothetical protein [Chitinimonas sp.]|uniref:hypothetical protein n=1 Tax=Chitinimonas sp. TaxID=1934313 RepID=UPI002F9464CC
MQIKRAIEVWEKGMDGALVGHWPVADTISPVRLLQLFAAEQQRPDPDMLLSYFLTADKLAALQPYVAQQLDAERYDFILTAFGLPSERAEAHNANEEEPFD